MKKVFAASSLFVSLLSAIATSQATPVSNALLGQSYARYIPHNYLHHKKHGVWLGYFGQASMQYGTTSILFPNSDISQSPQNQPIGPQKATFAVSLNHSDIMAGFDGKRTHFFADAGFAILPTYQQNPSPLPTGLQLVLKSANVDLLEAYGTYEISDHFGIKAGKMISDLGNINPTSPLQILPNHYTLLSATNTGIEGVFATNHFDVSLLGFITQESANIIRRQHDLPVPYLVHVAYKTNFKHTKIKASVAYQNQMNWTTVPSQTMYIDDTVTTGDVSLSYNKLSLKASLFRVRIVQDNLTTYMYGATGNWTLNPRMNISLYGDYVNNPKLTQYHWTLGAHYGYQLTCHVNLDTYLQVQKFQPHSGLKHNDTILTAVSYRL